MSFDIRKSKGWEVAHILNDHIIQRAYLNILRVVLCILLNFDINVHWCSQHSERATMSACYVLKAPSFPKIGLIIMPVTE